MASTKKPVARKPRLGRGLSSLIGAPVPVEAPKESRDEPVKEGGDQPQATQKAKPDKPGGEPSDSVERPADISQGDHHRSSSDARDGNTSGADQVRRIALDAIVPNRSQPRQVFDEAGLKSLAASIRADGVMQPIIVRPADTDGMHEIVAGERRWRAAKIAGLDTIPALVREIDDQQAAEWALIENLQREDLNPIERAEAFRHLLDRYELTHEDVAARVGADRSTITNALRLLSLSPEVRQMVIEGKLSNGQAKALAAVGDAAKQAELARAAIRNDWSVRKLEDTIRALQMTNESVGSSTKKSRSPHLEDLEQQIGQQLGTRVKIAQGRKKGAGKITIEYHSIDAFDELLERLGVTVE